MSPLTGLWCVRGARVGVYDRAYMTIRRVVQYRGLHPCLYDVAPDGAGVCVWDVRTYVLTPLGVAYHKQGREPLLFHPRNLTRLKIHLKHHPLHTVGHTHERGAEHGVVAGGLVGDLLRELHVRGLALDHHPGL